MGSTKKTALFDIHTELGARMVPFGGWDMPLQYASILEEGKHVRSSAGLFDLGHMGRFQVEGSDAVELVDRVITNHCAKVPAGGIRYALLCNEAGYPIDDLLFYRQEEGVYLVVNASNRERDLAWIRDHAGGLDARVVDQTEETAMIAIQGPRSLAVLEQIVDGADLSTLRYYRFILADVCGLPDIRISRTGYTGEDGFEIYLPNEEGPRVWHEILTRGADLGVQPIGLGARDILRLEAGMALYGHEIDEEHNPFEAGLAFAIALTPEKGDFVGRAGLERMASTREQRLVGITTAGKRVPRQGYGLYQGEERVGVICSGGVSPTLKTNIGSAFVRSGLDKENVELELDIRGKRQACRVRELPFYSRTRNKKSS